MASVGSALTITQPSPALVPVQQGPALGQQVATAQQNSANQQDTVTLTNQTADSQQTNSENTDAQFGQAAAFFFAESQTFRASNGSGGSQTGQPSIPHLPVKIADESVGDESEQSAQANVSSKTGEATDTSAQVQPQLSTPSASTVESETANTAIGTSQTPIAELAQLDTTLQQIGINPQSISLFNRMAMLLYANDPAALKVLVQTLQSGASQINMNDSSSAQQTASAGRSQASQSATIRPFSGQSSPGQAPTAGPSQPVSTSAETQSASRVPMISAGSNNQSTLALSIGSEGPSQGAASVDGRVGQTTLSLRMDELQSRFETMGGREPGQGSSSAQFGQLLDVSA